MIVVLLQQLDAAMKRPPYGFLRSLGNQWKYGNERWAVAGSIPYLLQKYVCVCARVCVRVRVCVCVCVCVCVFYENQTKSLCSPEWLSNFLVLRHSRVPADPASAWRQRSILDEREDEWSLDQHQNSMPCWEMELAVSSIPSCGQHRSKSVRATKWSRWEKMPQFRHCNIVSNVGKLPNWCNYWFTFYSLWKEQETCAVEFCSPIAN